MDFTRIFPFLDVSLLLFFLQSLSLMLSEEGNVEPSATAKLSLLAKSQLTGDGRPSSTSGFDNKFRVHA